MSFKPLLAAPADLSKIAYPVLVSPKLDGIRAIMLAGKLVSRKLLPIPNQSIQKWASNHLPSGYDGELMLSSHRIPFNEVSSAVMSREGEPDFRYAAFDNFENNGEFYDRYRSLQRMEPRIEIVPHTLVQNEAQLFEAEERFVAAGFEGLMVRSLSGKYKHGRSTVNEGILLKLKRFEDEEAMVIGAMERMTNTNEQTRDNLGHAKRSHAKAGKVPDGVLGALICQFDDGTIFDVGSGFTEEQRERMWNTIMQFRDDEGPAPVPGYPNSITIAGLYLHDVIVKHQPPPGGRRKGTKPRFPVFKGFRKD